MINNATKTFQNVKTIKWKYKFTNQLIKRGLSENFVKNYYEQKGWKVFNSSWDGYRLLCSNYFNLIQPLTQSQKDTISFLQQNFISGENGEKGEKDEKLKRLFTIRRGLPDLLLIDTTTQKRCPRFIEVKSNNDGLSVDQIKMAEILIGMGYDVTIFFVMFTKTFKHPRVSKRLKNWSEIKKDRETLFKVD